MTRLALTFPSRFRSPLLPVAFICPGKFRTSSIEPSNSFASSGDKKPRNIESESASTKKAVLAFFGGHLCPR